MKDKCIILFISIVGVSPLRIVVFNTTMTDLSVAIAHPYLSVVLSNLPNVQIRLLDENDAVLPVVHLVSLPKYKLIQYSKLNTLLCFNTRLKSMFYHVHFSDSIGDINQGLWCSPSSNNNMLLWWTFGEGFQYSLNR